LVSHTCGSCKKEGKAYLHFFKPRGWIKHKTPDDMNMLFCSLACFQKFTGADLGPRPKTSKKRVVAEEEKPSIQVPASPAA